MCNCRQSCTLPRSRFARLRSSAARWPQLRTRAIALSKGSSAPTGDPSPLRQTMVRPPAQSPAVACNLRDDLPYMIKAAAFGRRSAGCGRPLRGRPRRRREAGARCWEVCSSPRSRAASLSRVASADGRLSTRSLRSGSGLRPLTAAAGSAVQRGRSGSRTLRTGVDHECMPTTCPRSTRTGPARSLPWLRPICDQDSR